MGLTRCVVTSECGRTRAISIKRMQRKSEEDRQRDLDNIKKRKEAGEDGPSVIYPQAYITDIPVEFGDKEMRHLHLYNGVREEHLPMSIKFLAPKGDAETFCCIARYKDEEAFEQAVQCLSGVTVTTRSGMNKFVGASRAKAASWMVQKGLAAPSDPLARDHKPAWRENYAVMQRNSDQAKAPVAPVNFPRGELRIGGAGPFNAFNASKNSDQAPQAFITDIPVEFGDAEIEAMHLERGLESGDCPVSVKFLPSKDPSGVTRSCIARYRSYRCLHNAISGMHGAQYRLPTTHEVQKVVAREFKPWMDTQ